MRAWDLAKRKIESQDAHHLKEEKDKYARSCNKCDVCSDIMPNHKRAEKEVTLWEERRSEKASERM